MTVFDSSAVIAFLLNEPGQDVVEGRLQAGGTCGTVNWSEVAQKIRFHGRDWSAARTLLLAYELRLEPVTLADAEAAAARWSPGDGLSLADRLCLSLGERLDVEVLTADRAWGADGRIRQIR